MSDTSWATVRRRSSRSNRTSPFAYPGSGVAGTGGTPGTTRASGTAGSAGVTSTELAAAPAADAASKFLCAMRSSTPMTR